MDERYVQKDITELLMLNDDFVEQALLILYHFQTPDEKHTLRGCEVNKFGYNAHDAVSLASIAEKLLTFGYISDDEFKHARYGLQKYHRQLLCVLNHEIPNPLNEDIVVIDGIVKKRNISTYIIDSFRKFTVKMYTYIHGNSISAEAGTTGYCPRGPSSKVFIKLTKILRNDKISFKATRNSIEISASGDKQLSELLEGLEFIINTLKCQIREKRKKDEEKR